MSRKGGRVIRLRVALREIEPEIWRLIEVPETYSFWDLHVAIQDAMGWLDYHLHAFVPRSSSNEPQIGIPDDESGDEMLPGWEVPISRHLASSGDVLDYEYDFGDGWVHEIQVVEIGAREKGRVYPQCVDGARACPPEDCGGVSGYYELLEVLADPASPEYEEAVEWLKGHAKNYHPYDPDAFDPAAVDFSNPKKRFRIAFEQE